MSSETRSIDDTRDEIRDRHAEARDEVVANDPARHYIGGEWVESASSETFETRDPTTGEVLAEAQAGNSRGHRPRGGGGVGCLRGGVVGCRPGETPARANGIADRIEEHRDELAKLETLDNGKPIREARADVALVADQFRYFAGAVRTHGGETVPTGSGKNIQTIREPYGVVGAVVPGTSRS